MAHKEIKTSIVINSNRQNIWKVFSNFSDYKTWNPFIESIQGAVKVGNKIEVKAGGMKFRPEVLVYEEFKEFRWIGKLLFRGLFDGEHSFEIIDNLDGTCTFKHEEKFTGILVGLFSKKLERETKPGFEKMNQKLKEKVENLSNLPQKD